MSPDELHGKKFFSKLKSKIGAITLIKIALKRSACQTRKRKRAKRKLVAIIEVKVLINKQISTYEVFSTLPIKKLYYLQN
jgi:hypothetical protein